MLRILITGASRGLGLEYTRQLLARGERIFATCRNPGGAADLMALKEQYPEQLTVVALDVTAPDSIDLAYKMVARETDALDWLVNNAGVYPRGERIGNLDADTLLNTFYTNSVGPIMVVQRFLDLLRQGENARVVNVTSQLGSLARKTGGGSYSYCTSKAALNMLTRALAPELRSLDMIAIMMHPGWVQTDMGGGGASLTVSDAVSGMVSVVDSLTLSDSGRFLQWDGQELPW